MINSKKEKTIIGVLASHDDVRINQSLVELFNWLCFRKPNELKQFQFIFTGGTFDRIIKGEETSGITPVTAHSFKILNDCGITRLPSRDEGGMPIFSYFISQRLCSIVWGFWAPYQNHWLRAENLALMRLCDQWHVKRLMNAHSVQVWFEHEVENDIKRNYQPCPPKLLFRAGSEEEWEPEPFNSNYEQNKSVQAASISYEPFEKKLFEEMTIALIAHDDMKSRMIDFAIDHEAELKKFKCILATGTTGREVAAATSNFIDKKIFRYHSGPKGGDIEIASEIVYGKCEIVIFLIDTLHPHPHREDILVVFQACMISPKVIMITNEMHAREFMRNVVRGKDGV